jgi:hypothetical protein
MSAKQATTRVNFCVTYSEYDYQSANLFTVKVTYDSLLITDYCGTPNCKDSFQHHSALSSRRTKNYYYFIKSLHLDTLQSSYEKFASDGAAITIKVTGDSLRSTTISIINYPYPPAIQKLLHETFKFLPKKKSGERK